MGVHPLAVLVRGGADAPVGVVPKVDLQRTGESSVRGQLLDSTAVHVVDVGGCGTAIYFGNVTLGVVGVGVRGVVDHIACGIVLIGRADKLIIHAYTH